MKDFINRFIEYFRQDERRYFIIYKWLTGILAAFAVYYFYIIGLRPFMRYDYVFPDEPVSRKGISARDFNSYYLWPDSLLDKAAGYAFSEAFLLAKLDMAKEDTTSLIVNLKDSTVSLSIQGVTSFESPISGFEYSKILEKSDPFLTAKYFSWPFKIEEYFSSVPKIPVIVRKAPKDTIEAASMPEPTMLEENDQYVSFRLNLDRKLSIVFEQDSIPDTIDNRSMDHYRRRQKQLNRKSVRKALTGSVPYDYLPEIKVRLERDDALVIFRALPENADIAVRLGL
jgi:hypothetical protein